MKKVAFNIGEEFWLRDNQGIANQPAFSSIGSFISTVLPNVYVIAGLILLFLLIGGGLAFIIGAGQNNPERTAGGQKAISAALIGFLIIFASYWIIQLISFITGLDILSGGGL